MRGILPSPVNFLFIYLCPYSSLLGENAGFSITYFLQCHKGHLKGEMAHW